MKMRMFRYIAITFAVLLTLGAVGCGNGTDDSTVPQDEDTVIIQDYAYQPAEITIQSGETVTWINMDSVKHTATGDSFDSGLFGKDESFQQTFDETGTYDYICTPHPYMKGKVIVE